MPKIKGKTIHTSFNDIIILIRCFFLKRVGSFA